MLVTSINSGASAGGLPARADACWPASTTQVTQQQGTGTCRPTGKHGAPLCLQVHCVWSRDLPGSPPSVAVTARRTQLKMEAISENVLNAV